MLYYTQIMQKGIDEMKEFFGWGGYLREPEGYMSWQHLVFVSSLMLIMVACAVFFGLKNRKKAFSDKNKCLIFSAIFIDSCEIFKIIICACRSGDPQNLLYNLPLFLCSIQLIVIPLAAFSRGKLKEAALDFVFIFGILGAVLGTYAAGQNYGCYPVFSFDNVISGITHATAGFASLYIVFSGMESMKKKNIWITFSILLSFCVAASIANELLDYNYMFLRAGDGTPYDIIYNLVNGNQILYPILVIVLFLIYITVFYLVYYLIKKRLRNKG